MLSVALASDSQTPHLNKTQTSELTNTILFKKFDAADVRLNEQYG